MISEAKRPIIIYGYGIKIAKAENELDESEAYEILNLDITATFAQVKRRYRELVKKWHPDKNESAFKTEAEKKFVRINQAYETIMGAA